MGTCIISRTLGSSGVKNVKHEGVSHRYNQSTSTYDASSSIYVVSYCVQAYNDLSGGYVGGTYLAAFDVAKNVKLNTGNASYFTQAIANGTITTTLVNPLNSNWTIYFCCLY